MSRPPYPPGRAVSLGSVGAPGNWPAYAPGPRGSAGCAPRCKASISLGSSSIGSRKVPVQVPPCLMLNTDTPVSEYQLRRMVRELPRTSKKTSPSRGSGAASDADMVPIVALLPSLCPVRHQHLFSRLAGGWNSGREFRHPACKTAATDGIIIDRLAAARVVV